MGSPATSETGTDSLVSEYRDDEEQQSVTLEGLFGQLSRESHRINQNGSSQSPENSFSRIQNSISKLPKLESQLENKLTQELNKKLASASKRDIVRINDPISSKKIDTTIKEDSGSKWFNMPQPEMTAEIKRDLKIIQQRAALDPKRHYKRDKWQVPKYFQMGTVVGGPTDHFNKLTRKQRGTTLAEELLHDDTTTKYFKRKYLEIQVKKTSGRKAHYKKVKEMRKKY